MNFNKTSWHARLFFWSLGVIDKFMDTETTWHYANGTNLCHFVRVICVYMPLVLFLNLLLYATAACVLVYFPIVWFGWSAFGWLVGALVLLVGVCAGAVYLLEYREHASDNYDEPRKDPSTLRLVARWFAAKKQKICPLISFYESKEAN